MDFGADCTRILGAQLSITGSGSQTPSGSYLVSFPGPGFIQIASTVSNFALGAYSMSDPGVNLNIYSADAQTTSNYTVPGPGKCRLG